MTLVDQWTPHLPSKDEIQEMAVKIYWEENPQATTNPEDYELQAPEGKYYVKARSRLMGGYVSMLEAGLKACREEIRWIKERLSEIEMVVPSNDDC